MSKVTLSIVGLVCMALGGWYVCSIVLAALRRKLGDITVRKPEAAPETPAEQAATSLKDLLPNDGGLYIRTYSAERLISGLNLQGTINLIRQRSNFSRATFDQEVLPVLEQTIELVQLLPASESHHHSEPGGLAVHLLEVVAHALNIRLGMTLPQGVKVERIAYVQHIWTYAVLLGALFHDIAKPITNLTISGRKSNGSESSWHPLVGTMLTAEIVEYRLEFKSSQYSEHQKMAVLLAQKLIPGTGMNWLSEHGLIDELFQYLAGDSSSIIHFIVKKADSESTRNNLASGSRVRFAAARTEPLIERLMTALRAVLYEGGKISLNKPGAMGFVSNGEVYFVCKPLMQIAREWLAAHGDTSIPGSDKDDRLYDTLQEYRAIITNPMTHGAIWNVQIVMDQSDRQGGMKQWKQNLTVLRFPLEKLFKSPTEYPTSLSGTINILYNVASQTQIEHTTTQPAVASEAAEHKPEQQESADSYVELTEAAPHDNGFSSEAGHHLSTSTQSTVEAAPAMQFLDSADDVSSMTIGRSSARKPSAPKKPPPAKLLPAVAVPFEAPKSLVAGKREKEAPEAALTFMRWVQESVVSGELTLNNSEAMLHKVPEGLLLVSPKIFRHYANSVGEVSELEVQRALTKAGWHKKTDIGSINIMRYSIQGGRALSGIVIQNPERFLASLPPDNPVLEFNEKLTMSSLKQKA